MELGINYMWRHKPRQRSWRGGRGGSGGGGGGWDTGIVRINRQQPAAQAVQVSDSATTIKPAAYVTKARKKKHLIFILLMFFKVFNGATLPHQTGLLNAGM